MCFHTILLQPYYAFFLRSSYGLLICNANLSICFLWLRFICFAIFVTISLTDFPNMSACQACAATVITQELNNIGLAWISICKPSSVVPVDVLRLWLAMSYKAAKVELGQTRCSCNDEEFEKPESEWDVFDYPGYPSRREQ